MCFEEILKENAYKIAAINPLYSCIEFDGNTKKFKRFIPVEVIFGFSFYIELILSDICVYTYTI